MKATQLISIIFLLFSLVSCGPNRDEQTAVDKIKMDSVAAAVRKAMNDSIIVSQKIQELLAQKKFTNDAIVYLEICVDKFKNDQANAEVDLESVKSFHLGRMQSEKEQEISNQLSDKKKVESKLELSTTLLKIFRRASRLMDDMESKQFTSIKEFEKYKNDLYKKIDEKASEVLEDSNSPGSNEFKFETVINNKSFKNEVKSYKDDPQYMSTNNK